jgi:hypothetical protein
MWVHLKLSPRTYPINKLEILKKLALSEKNSPEFIPIISGGDRGKNDNFKCTQACKWTGISFRLIKKRLVSSTAFNFVIKN